MITDPKIFLREKKIPWSTGLLRFLPLHLESSCPVKFLNVKSSKYKRELDLQPFKCEALDLMFGLLL